VVVGATVVVVGGEVVADGVALAGLDVAGLDVVVRGAMSVAACGFAVALACWASATPKTAASAVPASMLERVTTETRRRPCSR
jgi:hypothetical protein